MGLGGGVNLGKMIRQQQQAADQQRDRRRRAKSRTSSEPFLLDLGSGACTVCAQDLPLTGMSMTADGPCCDPCGLAERDDSASRAGAWAAPWLVLLSPLAVAYVVWLLVFAF